MPAPAQDAPAASGAFRIQDIYRAALGEQAGVATLRYLAEDIGARPAGSPAYARAAAWTADELRQLGLETQLQPVRIPAPWRRGRPAHATLTLPSGRREALLVVALGNSPGTGAAGVRGELVELHSLDAADSVGAGLRGKVAFYNRPFDRAAYDPFQAYGGAVDQRVYGPARAAQHGAVGAIVRSMTPATDRTPHTGSTVFPEGGPRIPAAAVSTVDADRIDALLDTAAGSLTLALTVDAQTLPPATDHNVIADWPGSERPGEIVLIGAHLDSWDLGDGAHDDGAGVAHVLEAVHLLRRVGFSPQRTLRVVLFANEERGLDGARAYWRLSDSLGLRHVAAVESDRGGYAPRGFTVDAPLDRQAALAPLTAAWRALLEPYGVTFAKGGGGADISGLKERGAVLFGLKTDPQRYFDLHHTARDVFAEVHPREFELGAAAIASLVVLLDAAEL